MAKRRSEEEIRGLLSEFASSGLTGAEFAGEVGVSASTLSNWRRKYGSGEPCGFIEVGEVGAGGGRVYVLDFSGVRLEVPAGFERGEVAELVSLLREGHGPC